MTKIAINGFGRIGRAAFKIAAARKDLTVVAINDLGSIDNLAYLLRYDSVYGRYDQPVKVQNDNLVVKGRKTQVLSEKDPAKLPWRKLKVDVVLESTGVFTEYEGAKGHLTAGAKSVVISAPTKSDQEIPTILMGVNSDQLDTRKNPIIANASCTTNAVAPVAEIMCRHFPVKKAILNTVHAYTATQSLVDGPCEKDFRRGRAATLNMAITSTGAAEATAKAVPALKGKFTGLAVRVPAAVVSLVDVVFVLSEKVTAAAVNKILAAEAKTPRYRGILGLTVAPLVSADLCRTTESSIVDPEFTRVVDGDLVKIMIWYDNEWAYAVRLVDQAEAIAANLKK